MGGRIKKFMLNLDDFVSAISVVLIVIITVAGVFMRFVMHDPLKWTEEATLALFVCLTFMGASSVMKQDGHVSIDILVEKAPKSVQKWLLGFKYFVVLLLLIVIFIILGSQLALNAWDKITPILRIRYTFIDLAIPLGGFLAAIHIIRLMIKNLRRVG